MVRYMKGSVEVLDFDNDDNIIVKEKRIGYRYVGTAAERADIEALGEGDEFYEADTEKLYVWLNGSFEYKSDE